MTYKKQSPILFATLHTQGKLYQHCAQIDTQAQQMFNTHIEQMTKSKNIAEGLKAQNQLKWVRRMNSIQNNGTEITTAYFCAFAQGYDYPSKTTLQTYSI